jgi:protein-S-isoprenylcysteine O-methyltransferase Ste14
MALAAKALGAVVISFVVTALILFLSAGTVVWPAGWIFLILLHGFPLVGNALLLKSNPGVLQERMTLSQPNQKAWDKVFLSLLGLLYLAWLVLMPLDAVRFHWSQVPFFLQVIGALTMVGSFSLMYLTFRENPFLSPTVRVQPERGQTVVSTGLYRYVRHPLYASSLPLFLGPPLLLSSWYGLVLSLVMMTGVAVRAVLEEQVLRSELPGYEAYMAQVRYRFLPHVW